ncbi:helix-turn-helix domain-containing protein [Rhodococcus sp. (in: high G+C Gram-positive bacteria)]|uniref:PucR family transcriptional regulator n=1 Tax=Rhodococcus sp. TaxID=1831 RepID=UPI00257E392E|nr:helix-turn-helix domain-containing protein [Rhodococcus sp. (in: high G+C Gram-positive bacteria)]MBQ7805730.1 helix-turn-helix domain-containing protein [Rhodococcus sp. (in: high G+C Gram-positive bacteria)]
MSIQTSPTNGRRDVAQVALDWQTRLSPALEAVLAAISDGVPETTAPEVEPIVRVTCEGNLQALVGHMARGVPLDLVDPSAELRSLTATLATMGFALSSIMRAYHVGAEETVHQWMLEVDRQNWPRDDSVAVIREGTAFMLRWLIALTDGVTFTYQAETDRIAKDRDFARIERVRRILQDSGISERNASRELGYALTGTHVALVQVLDTSTGIGAPVPLSEQGTIFEQTLRTLGLPIDPVAALHVRVDLHTVWSWIPSTSEALSRLNAIPGPVLVGIGTSRSGVSGFRISHQEAQEAVRVARLRSHPTGRVTRFNDVETVSLCTQDVQRAADFVRNELGPIAQRTPAMDQLRETLARYLECNSNARAAAAKLYVHHNTVRARIERIESLLGHPVALRRFALELAMNIDQTVGPERA